MWKLCLPTGWWISKFAKCSWNSCTPILEYWKLPSSICVQCGWYLELHIFNMLQFWNARYAWKNWLHVTDFWQYHLNIVTFLCYQFTYLEAPSLLWHVGPFFVPAMCNREVLHHQIPRQHCRLTIWKQFVELTNSIKSDNMIQIIWLILGRGALSTNTLRTKYITFQQ